VIEDAVTHETFHEESTTVASSSHCPVTQRDMMLETAGKQVIAKGETCLEDNLDACFKQSR
jgi:hypothetical protein